jgi:group I intron endonuclease
MIDASGIYSITNAVNSRQYIGSAVNLRKRKNIHLSQLRNGKHRNRKLQAAFNKYGESAFLFEVVELVEKDDLIAAEQRHMDRLDPFYNIAKTAGSTLGVKFSEEAKEKIAAAARGKKRGPFTEEHRANISAATKGKRRRPLTDEERARVSESSRACWSDEKREAYRERARTAFLGKGHTDEAKELQRAAKVKFRYLITAPDGTEHVATSMKHFCATRDIHACAMMRVARGEQEKHKGWTVRAEPVAS